MTALLKQVIECIKVSTQNTSKKISAVLEAGLSNLSRYPIVLSSKKVNHALTGGLILIAIGISLYWLMHILQIPSPPDSATNTKGATLASNQNTGSASVLFGEKPIAAQNIFLRGIVITSKNTDSTLEGFAIFEINGKPTNAIAIGEGLGNGLTLKSIKPESATLLYQGQEMEFTLSKSKSTPSATNKIR